MDVKANSLYQEMQNMIGQSRLQVNEPQTLPDINPTKDDFSNMLKQAVDGVNGMQLELRVKRKVAKLFLKELYNKCLHHS